MGDAAAGAVDGSAGAGERGERATIVGATGRDGGAAIDASAGRERTDIFILFPHGKVSLGAAAADDDIDGVQRACARRRGQFRRIAASGEGDVQRRRVPRQGEAFWRQLDQLGAHQHGADRLLLTTAITLGAPDRKVSFTVPTGNFGDIAGYCAKRMGLLIGKLVVATNENDIMARTIKTGRYEMKDVKATTSPSMDIQISSTERLRRGSGDDALASGFKRMKKPEAQPNGFDISADAMVLHQEGFSRFAAPAKKQVAETIVRLRCLKRPAICSIRIRRSCRGPKHETPIRRWYACHRASGQVLPP